jgi:hypothetical protein
MKKTREENSLGTVPLLKKSQSLDILRWVTAEGLVPVTVRILADTIDYFPFLSQSGFWDPHGIYVDNFVIGIVFAIREDSNSAAIKAILQPLTLPLPVLKKQPMIELTKFPKPCTYLGQVIFSNTDNCQVKSAAKSKQFFYLARILD